MGVVVVVGVRTSAPSRDTEAEAERDDDDGGGRCGFLRIPGECRRSSEFRNEATSSSMGAAGDCDCAEAIPVRVEAGDGGGMEDRAPDGSDDVDAWAGLGVGLHMRTERTSERTRQGLAIEFAIDRASLGVVCCYCLLSCIFYRKKRSNES